MYPNYNVAAFPDLLDGLMAVSTGKVDGLVDDIFPIVYMIRQRRISNLKIATAVDKSLQPQGFAVGVRKDWPELAGILDKVLTDRQPRGAARDLAEVAVGALRKQGRLSRDLDFGGGVLRDPAGGGAVDSPAQPAATRAAGRARRSGSGEPRQRISFSQT